MSVQKIKLPLRCGCRYSDTKDPDLHLMIAVSHRTCNGRRNSSRGDSQRHTDGMLRGHRSTNKCTVFK